MKRLTLFLLILSGALFSASQARAVSFSYNAGDLLMGFWDPSGNGQGGGEDYLVDLGSITNFENLAPGASFTILSNSSSIMGNIGLDLTGTFGTNWIDNKNLEWGLAGEATSNDPTHTIYASVAEEVPGTIQAGWASSTSSTLAGPSGKIDFTGLHGGDSSITPNSKDATGQQDTATDSWDSYMYGQPNASPNAFGYFGTSGTDFGIGGTFGDGDTTAGDDPLDLYQLVPGSPSTKETNYIASFSIDSSGDITVKNLETVPEPTTYALMAWGAGCLLLLARRGFLRPRDRSPRG
jgi:hypothetical protein